MQHLIQGRRTMNKPSEGALKANNEKYPHNTHGIWVIKGEDPNCDMGGSHVSPTLGYARGKYIDVLSFGRMLPRWNTWSPDGGRVEAIEVMEIDGQSVPKRVELQQEKNRLEKELEEVTEKLEVRK